MEVALVMTQGDRQPLFCHYTHARILSNCRSSELFTDFPGIDNDVPSYFYPVFTVIMLLFGVVRKFSVRFGPSCEGPP